MSVTSRLKITGMHCDACAQRIERVFRRQPGVRRAEVSFAEREARVTYDEQSIGPEDLRKAVERAGYSVEAIESSS